MMCHVIFRKSLVIFRRCLIIFRRSQIIFRKSLIIFGIRGVGVSASVLGVRRWGCFGFSADGALPAKVSYNLNL